MSVVVTGAAGFLGRALVASLAADGIAVVAVDRRPPPDGPGVTALRADLLDRRPGRHRGAARRRRGLPPRRPARRTGHRRRRRRRPDQGQRARDGRGAGHRAAADRRWSSPRPRPCTAAPPAGRPGRPTRRARSARTRAARRRWSCSAPAGRSRCCGRSRWPARGSGRTWRWPAGSPRSGPAGRSGSSARRSAPGTSPTCGTWSGRPGWRPSGGVVGPLNVGTGRPRTLAELAGAVCRVLGAPAELVVAPGGRGRAGRDLGRHHPAGPYARLRAGHRPRRRGRPPGPSRTAAGPAAGVPGRVRCPRGGR